MKKLLFLLILPFLLSAGVDSTYTLTVKISGLENDKGQVILALNNEKDELVQDKTVSIKNGKCTIVLRNVKKGTYSFKYFHDENKDKELNTNWIGMPTEGFGFSNDAKGRFGPPDKEDTLFKVQGNVIQNCTAIYL